MTDITDTYIELIEKRGDNVGLNADQCKKWMKKHENCKGCITELGCGKVVCLGLLTLSAPSILKAGDCLDRILDAKTPGELLAIDLKPVCEY